MAISSLKTSSRCVIVALLMVLAGCASTPERQPLPREYTNKAGIPSVPEARFWGDEWPTFSVERFATFTESDFGREFPSSYDRPHNYLAISGGGANGAFGAGLLVGWTATGKRPEFNMVSGVSTGALTAPFVFLGSDYDEVMKTLYTTTTTKDIVTKRNPIAAAFSDSMADTTPLRELIAKYIDVDMIAAIAREHKKGRRLYVGTLYVGTVNLDAGRSVIWNIGAIAASDYPGKKGVRRSGHAPSSIHGVRTRRPRCIEI